MIFTFRELGIHLQDYEGLSPQHRDALIINQACDYIMEKFFPRQSEHWVIPDATNSWVHPASRTLCVYTNPVCEPLVYLH